jgi:hypothetical protein
MRELGVISEQNSTFVEGGVFTPYARELKNRKDQCLERDRPSQSDISKLVRMAKDLDAVM